ncbi:MAG: hypothetical protein IJZ74_02505 [Clostridia bacterium]|nr:hypothetical protein [Clostridia bacterium]
MKNVTKLISLVMALCMLLGVVPAMAEAVPSPAADAVTSTAFLMYADGAWVNQIWNPGEQPEGIKVTEAKITGEGDYTVGLDFTGTADGAAAGLAFTALGISEGEGNFPGWKIKINEIRVNGAPIAFQKGYTSSDDQVVTRMNIYNEWVTELPADARSFDGNIADATARMVDVADFASVQTFEVDFSFIKQGIDTAYIMYADSSWAQQYWLDGNAYGGVTATNAVVTGAGDYTVGLDFTTTEAGVANGIAFTALGIKKGENLFPGAQIKINAIRVNGEAIEFSKGYTSSDDGVETRMNVYNAWVSEVPTDASVRSWDGTTEGAAPVIIDPALLAEVKTIEIDFTLLPKADKAFLMFADETWAVSAWNPGEYAENNTVTIEGPGTYSVKVDFAEPVTSFAFLAVGIAKGELTFPGYFMDVTDVKVNGESIEITKDFTTTDENVTTRVNIWNTWVTELPAQARRHDGDLEGATTMIAALEALSNVSSLEVTFNYIYGEPAVAEEPAMTEEELKAALAADYNAYVAVQSESYIFRNDWYEPTYGRDSVDYPDYFNRLTGWDAESNAVDYGGTFVDAAITGNGTYTVTMTTGDHGFGEDTLLRFLRVTTDIPSKLVADGHVTISDCKVKIGDGKTQEGLTVVTDGDYVTIVVRDEYNKIEPAFGYMPGPNTAVTFTFTVSGLAD